MKLAIGPTLALGVILAASTACAAEDAAHHPYRHHPGHHPTQAAEPRASSAHHALPVEEPAFRPFRPGEGDTDGLSRDPDDCNMGCIGGNPG